MSVTKGSGRIADVCTADPVADLVCNLWPLLPFREQSAKETHVTNAESQMLHPLINRACLASPCKRKAHQT